jgi:hypothetical protein
VHEKRHDQVFFMWLMFSYSLTGAATLL